MDRPSKDAVRLVNPARVAAGPARDLDGFLAATGVRVLDVSRGAAPGTRRLLLGESDTRFAAYSVAVADGPDSVSALEAEVRLIDELRSRATPAVLATLPRVVAPVTIGDRPAIVLTAVPGHEAADRPRPERQPRRADLDAVGVWLADLWRSTFRLPEPVELGRGAADQLLARYCGSRQLAPTLSAVHAARRCLGSLRVGRTAVHGCLCPRHAHVRDGVVVGVDDWGSGAPSGDPLRDLGGLAVWHAGPNLPEVVADRTPLAHLLRDFVMAGLVTVGLPARRWRDVLLLTQAEKAITALDRGRVNDIRLLVAAVEELPREHGEPEAAQP